MNDNFEERWILPPLTQPLVELLTEIHGMAKGGLEDQNQGEHEEVKGLKFISNKLIKLFEKNRKLKYSNISKILIDNFSSESNDSRNIKRRVYDAINVMIAAGLFVKNGDILEKQESLTYRDRVEVLKSEIGTEQKQLQTSVANKTLLIARLAKRKIKLKELIQRNKKNGKPKTQSEIISNPIFVNLKEGTKMVKLNSEEGVPLYQIDIGKSSRVKSKSNSKTHIHRDQ